MKKYSLPIYGIAVFFLVTLAAAGIAVFRVNLRSGDERAVAILSRRDAHSQAAKWIFHQTPFCYRFKTKVAYLPGLSPFTQDLGRIERQNSHGFRTIEYTIAHPPNTFRILLLGNGYVHGGSVPVEQTFPYVTSMLMNRKCGQFHTQVIALGTHGSRLADSLIRLLAHGQYLKPDLVIFQLSPTDLDFYNYGTIFYLHGMQNVFTAYCAKQAEVLSEGSVDWMVFQETLVEIRKWSDETKTPVAFLLFPEIDGQRSGNNFMQYDPQRVASLPQITEFRKVVDEIQKQGFPELYLLDTIKRSNQYLAISDVISDLNVAAHRLVAESLVSFLLDRRLIDCVKPNMHKQDALWGKEQALRQKAVDDWEKFNANYSVQLPFFQTLADMYPKDPWVAAELAETYGNLQRYRQAYRRYASLLDLVPEIAAPWYQMALSGVSPEERTHLLERMLKEVPDHTLSMQALARMYLQTNRKTGACPLISRLIEIPTYTAEYLAAKTLFKENGCDKLSPKLAGN